MDKHEFMGPFSLKLWIQKMVLAGKWENTVKENTYVPEEEQNSIKVWWKKWDITQTRSQTQKNVIFMIKPGVINLNQKTDDVLPDFNIKNVEYEYSFSILNDQDFQAHFKW